MPCTPLKGFQKNEYPLKYGFFEASFSLLETGQILVQGALAEAQEGDGVSRTING